MYNVDRVAIPQTDRYNNGKWNSKRITTNNQWVNNDYGSASIYTCNNVLDSIKYTMRGERGYDYDRENSYNNLLRG